VAAWKLKQPGGSKRQVTKKPVVGFIAGQTAPPGRRMGHAGAIVGGADDTAAAKMKIMSECGIHVVSSPADIAKENGGSGEEVSEQVVSGGMASGKYKSTLNKKNSPKFGKFFIHKSFYVVSHSPLAIPHLPLA
jgi:hypothetical protein